MEGGKRDIAEKGLVLMNLNEFQRTIGASVDNIALRSDHATVFFEFGVEVFSPMPLRIPHELIPISTRIISAVKTLKRLDHKVLHTGWVIIVDSSGNLRQKYHHRGEISSECSGDQRAQHLNLCWTRSRHRWGSEERKREGYEVFRAARSFLSTGSPDSLPT